MLIFGHRGAPGYPRKGENTRASFRKALAAGADGLEFDVRRCNGGAIVVIHDETIDRTTNGRGRVHRLTYEELRKLDAGSGETIPLLTEVLDEFGGQCVLNIELKDDGIANEIQKLVLERKLQSNVIVSAFHWEELRPLQGHVQIALLSSRTRSLIPSAIEMKAHAIHPRCTRVTSKLLDAAHRAGLKVYTWTVNDTAEMLRLRDLGVDGIFTDFPAAAVAAAGSMK